MLIREAIAQGSADLKYAEIKTPGLDASLLLSYILNLSRASLIAAGNEKLSEKNCETFCELIERRCNGECVAYIIGKKEFRDLVFIVNKSVLVPRPDTETLVEAAIEIISRLDKNETQINVLDLCTGSGAVAISLKNEISKLDLYATDICADALEVAKQNAKNLLGDNQIQFFPGDLYNALPINNFSIIVSNPPYIPSCEIETLSVEVQNEPRLALDGGENGLEIIERIIKKAPEYLQNGGYLLLEASPDQMENITILLEKNRFIDIKLYNDLSGSKRVIGGKLEK